MTVLTRKREALLDQLISVAGDASTVEEALRSLNEESASPPDLRAVIRRILEIKKKRDSSSARPA